MKRKQTKKKVSIIDAIYSPKFPKWFMELSDAKKRKVAAQVVKQSLGKLKPSQEKALLKEAVKGAKARSKTPTRKK